MISHHTRHGQVGGRGVDEQWPAQLLYQRYQFSSLSGRFRKRSYRRSLRVEVPKDVADCHRLIRKLAKKIYIPNNSVDVEDLVQTGEAVLAEQLPSFETGIVRRPEVAWRILMETIQSEMFHSIDQRLVSLSGTVARMGKDDEDDDCAEISELSDSCLSLPVAQCNRTVSRSGMSWYFLPDCCASWGTPLPPGSCQPWPGSLCESPWHLPVREWRADYDAGTTTPL